MGLPRDRIYVSFSGRKGYHVEVFFDRIVDGGTLFNLYCHVIKNGELDPDKVEFRPTPSMAIKLPLSVHGSTGNICWFVDRETFISIEDEHYILSIEQVRVDDAQHALTLPELEINGKRRCAAQHKSVVASKPAEDNDTGITLTEQGKRHNTMLRIAVFHRTNGYAREEAQKSLENWYARQPQQYINSSPEEVAEDIASILDWTYSDRFILPRAGNKDGVFVSGSQLQIALCQRSRSDHRIAFLLLMRTRMNECQISAADIGKATGISTATVYEVVHRLSEAGVIIMEKGRRLQLPDQSFVSEAIKYTVPHKEMRSYEMVMKISMKELMGDFDRTYHLALHTLVPQGKLHDLLGKVEWQEYLSWAEAFEEEDLLPKEKRIDLLGTPHDLSLPIKLVRPITAYEVDGRLLFPAYDMALILRFAGPSVIGSLCPNKEMWQVQVNRRILPNGKISHQVLGKNFIPMEDVLDLVTRSSVPEKEAIAKYLMDLEVSETHMDEKGVSVL